jgi:ABC-type multidrug transport system fused ATPase/permease subunit
LSLIAPRIESFSKAKAAAQQVFQTISMVSSIDSFSSTGERPAPICGNIELNNVSFAYPCRSEGKEHEPEHKPHPLSFIKTNRIASTSA